MLTIGRRDAGCPCITTGNRQFSSHSRLLPFSWPRSWLLPHHRRRHAICSCFSATRDKPCPLNTSIHDIDAILDQQPEHVVAIHGDRGVWPR